MYLSEQKQRLANIKSNLKKMNAQKVQKLKMNSFKFKPFSKKQKQILSWWAETSKVRAKDGIIADGSIRAGKTLSMSLSYGLWAMNNFNNNKLLICGKTIGSLRRNVISDWVGIMRTFGYHVKEMRTESVLVVSKGNVSNLFYLFGGKDEASQDLVQGITAAGAFFDEVALMPESFVNQATGRCSITGSKFWFNCNPGGPYHWFKLEWIDNLSKKNMLHVHFTMDDNLSLDDATKKRYLTTYSGVFYDRYILGKWAAADGLIYDMFDEGKHTVPTIERPYEKYYTSCDYGTQNPTVFGLWGKHDNVWYKVKEYYYNGREERKQKTDKQFADDYLKFIGRLDITAMIIDPSAASFIAELRGRGVKVIPANNSVIDGIRVTSTLFESGVVKLNDCCEHTKKEFRSYTWDIKRAQKGEDVPVKQNDHAMDETRYFCYTILKHLVKPTRKNYSGKGARN